MHNLPKNPKLAQRIDELEKKFIDKEYSIARLAKLFNVSEEEIVEALNSIGLEVEGKVRSDLASSSTTVMDRSQIIIVQRGRYDD